MSTVRVPRAVVEDALALIADMTRFVGSMALQNYQRLNEVPIALKAALDDPHGEFCLTCGSDLAADESEMMPPHPMELCVKKHGERWIREFPDQHVCFDIATGEVIAHTSSDAGGADPYWWPQINAWEAAHPEAETGMIHTGTLHYLYGDDLDSESSDNS